MFTSPRHRTAWTAAAACLLALACIAGPVSAAKKRPKPPLPKLVVLGASSQTTAPACPASPCQAIGKVTGFQTAIAGQPNPFVAPFDGRVVAWSIKLATTTETQTAFFRDFYGAPPKARVAILKPRKGKKKKAFTLRAQSPVEELTGLGGTTTTFALAHALPVRKGQIVALSVPTWAPAFSVGQPKSSTWLASRKAGRCNAADDIKAGSPQVALGQRRTYGCSYNTARLLYSATLLRGAAVRR